MSYKAFTSADANNDNFVDMTEMLNWIALNEHFSIFLNMYEPLIEVKYEDQLYSKFPPLDI